MDTNIINGHVLPPGCAWRPWHPSELGDLAPPKGTARPLLAHEEPRYADVKWDAQCNRWFAQMQHAPACHEGEFWTTNRALPPGLAWDEQTFPGGMVWVCYRNYGPRQMVVKVDSHSVVLGDDVGNTAVDYLELLEDYTLAGGGICGLPFC